MLRTARLALPATLLLAAGVAALGAAPAQAMRGSRPVMASANHFVPAEVSVPQGQSLLFANLDLWPHDITGDNGRFGVDASDAGVVAVPGTELLPRGAYTYTCSIHDGMVGILRIT